MLDDPLLEIRNVFRNYQITISCFLIDMKFIFKLLSILLMQSPSFSDPHLRLFKISKFHILKFSKFQDFKISKFQKFKIWVHTCSDIFDIFDSQISKDHIFPGCFCKQRCSLGSYTLTMATVPTDYSRKFRASHEHGYQQLSNHRLQASQVSSARRTRQQ